MTSTDNDAATVFTLERRYPVAPEVLFAFWVDPSKMATWFCPNPDLATSCTLDPVVDGAWSCRMGPYLVGGRYQVVEPPHRLVFSWAWSAPEPTSTTVAIVTLTAEGDGTLLRLTHSEDAADADGHQEGWRLTLGRLQDSVSRIDHS